MAVPSTKQSMNTIMSCELLSKTVVFKCAYVEKVSEGKVRNDSVRIYQFFSVSVSSVPR
jgi:hypothetical protein